jgi:hypothetical protein
VVVMVGCEEGNLVEDRFRPRFRLVTPVSVSKLVWFVKWRFEWRKSGLKEVESCKGGKGCRYVSSVRVTRGSYGRTEAWV